MVEGSKEYWLFYKKIRRKNLHINEQDENEEELKYGSDQKLILKPYNQTDAINY